MAALIDDVYIICRGCWLIEERHAVLDKEDLGWKLVVVGCLTCNHVIFLAFSFLSMCFASGYVSHQ